MINVKYRLISLIFQIFYEGIIKMWKMICAATVIAASPVLATNAAAYDWSLDTTVSLVEVTYMPDRVTFQIPSNVGSCTAGTFLAWDAQGSTEALKISNAQAVLAVLMTAHTTGQKVRLFGNNVGCTISYLYLV